MSDTRSLDALVIRNIADIEAAILHAQEGIGPQLWEEVTRVVQAACEGKAWTVFSDIKEHDVWIADEGWMMSDQRKPKADFYLNLDERFSGDNDGENSWLATFVASGPKGTTMALWLDQRILGPAAWKKIVKSNEGIVAELRRRGFSVDDDDDRRLCLPVVLDREQLPKRRS